MSYFSETGVYYSDAAQLDAFGRLRISNPLPLFEAKQVNDDIPLKFDDQETSGSGTSSTHNTNQASTTLSVSNLTAGTRVRQSKRRINYQPGHGQQALVTFLMGAAASGITKRVGLFNDNDGIFLESLDTTISLVVRTNTSSTPSDTNKVAQASWNIDPMDGSGPSGLTLDLTKVNLLFIDFAWLGVSRVRVGFVIGGVLHYVHEFNTANIETLVYMSNPSLPIRYEIANSGTGPAADLVTICSSVSSEGGSDTIGISRSADTGIVEVSTLSTTNIYLLLALRLGAIHINSEVILRSIEVLVTSAVTAFRWALLLNPTVAGAALSFVAESNSVVEIARPTSATTVTGGTIILSGYGSGSIQAKTSITALTEGRLGAFIDDTSDVFVLAVQVPGATPETFLGAISWTEVE